MKKILGYVILVSPFIALFVFLIIKSGFWPAFLPFLIVAFVIGMARLGFWLINKN